jgi:hypothetical protein
MKALKEKRISLRSLWRRSVVILSLLALAFAACSSDSSDEPGGPVTPPAGPTVVAINILQIPTGPSYQGSPPDLTGFIAEVTWSNGDKKIETDVTKFVPIPGYCDVPATTVAVTGQDLGIGISYVGNPAVVQPLLLRYVAPALRIHVTGTAKRQVWYSDQRPDFDGLTMEIEYADAAFTAWNTAVNSGDVPGPTLAATKKTVTMTPAYPKLAMGTPDPANPLRDFNVTQQVPGDALDRKFFTVFIGRLTTPANSDRYAIFTVKEFHHISSVEFDSAVWPDGGYFDDDTSKFATELDCVARLIEGKVKFKVFYFDGHTRTIDMDEFLGNVNFDAGMIQGSVNNYPSSWTTAFPGELQWVDDDTLGIVTFLTIEYTPWFKYDVGGTAYTTVAGISIPVPVFEFTDAMIARRKAGSGPNNVRVIPLGNPVGGALNRLNIANTGAAQEFGEPPVLVAANSGTNLLRAINDKWELVGTYSRGGTDREKVMKVTKEMLADGQDEEDNLSNGYIYLNEESLGLGTYFPATIATGQIGRNYPLPIKYRGAMLDRDPDGTVVVDLTP